MKQKKKVVWTFKAFEEAPKEVQEIFLNYVKNNPRKIYEDFREIYQLGFENGKIFILNDLTDKERSNKWIN